MEHDGDPPLPGPTRTRQLVERGRHLQAAANERLLIARASHASVKLLMDALREDRDTGGALLAGALAFRLFLWLLPAGLLLVALLGFSSPGRVGEDLAGAGLGGFAASTIAQATAQAQQARWLLLLIGLVALHAASVGLAKAMWIGTSLAWHLPVARLRLPPKAAAALLIGVGIQVLHLVTAFYLVNRISTSSQLYGALGGAATLLLWGYLLARVLIGASTVNHTLFRYRDAARLRPGDDRGEPVPMSMRNLPARLRADWHGIVAAVTPRGPAVEGSPPPGDEEAQQIATLTVWRFDDEDGADRAGRTLGELERKGLIRIIDAAVVTWPVGARRPRTSQVLSTAASGALGGSFWGLLFGVIFFAPLLGLAVGAATGALGGSMRHAGLSDAFIRQVRDEITPGTSALFVVTTDAIADEVRDAFVAHRPRLIHTSLTPEQDAALREYFRT